MSGVDQADTTSGDENGRLESLRVDLGRSPLAALKIYSAAQKIAALSGQGIEADCVRIAVLGELTTTLVAQAAACGAVQEGMFPIIREGRYGALVQESLGKALLEDFDADVVLLAPDARRLITLPVNASSQELEAAVEQQVALFEQIWAALRVRPGRRIIQHTLLAPPLQYCGPAERCTPGSPRSQIARLNDRLAEAAGARVVWLDTERLAAEVGVRNWVSPRFYYNGRIEFDPRYLPDYLLGLRASLRQALSREKKVLVLDLDNTLWGGVIGDDGVEGIVLGPGSSDGEAFLDWQIYVKALKDRGVVLAVCSKNDPEIAATAFSHPDAFLARSDFAAFHCSWEDKVTGLTRIAAELNVSLDSFVFADDNPAECEIVQQALPVVSVVDLGADPTEFIGRFDRGRWFDRQRFTDEDFSRQQGYAARRVVQEAIRSVTDVGAYLASLAMVGRMYRPSGDDLSRMAQLEAKTNQFNVTTRRYDEAALLRFLDDDAAAFFAFRLKDRLANHGLVSSLLAFQEGGVLRIDSWLMSCRVFSRTAEQFLMNGLIMEAQRRGCTTIVAEYRRTDKNGVTAELYSALGFEPVDDSGAHWRRSAGACTLETHIAAE